MNEKDKLLYVIVEGEQVFTAEFVFQQIQALNARIDRANIALVSLGISIIAAAAIILILLQR